MPREGQWRFALEDHSGGLLTTLSRADSRQVSFRRKAAPEASVTLGLEDPDALILVDALRNGIPILRATRDETTGGDTNAVLHHRGFIGPEAVREDLTNYTVSFISSPITKLEARYTPELRGFDPTDAGEIAWTLIDEAQTGWPDTSEPTADVGISQGTLEPTYTAEPVYERKGIPDAIRELADSEPGFDWELAPVDGGATVADYNVYTDRGSFREEAKFAKGDGTLDNCQLIERTRERLRNRVFVFGGSGVWRVEDDDDSIARYGLWDHHETMAEEIVVATLTARAKELLTPFPKELIQVTPEPTRAPKPLIDYDIGDTVPLYARAVNEGSDDYEINAIVRIEGIDITIDSDGNESGHTLQVVPV